MEGTVRKINPVRGMVAIELRDDGSFTIVEVLGSVDLEVDDVVRGPLRELGSAELMNITKSDAFDVIVQNFDVTAGQLPRQLLVNEHSR